MSSEKIVGCHIGRHNVKESEIVEDFEFGEGCRSCIGRMVENHLQDLETDEMGF